MRTAVKVFIAAIAAMGVARFTLDRMGMSRDVVKYFSMSAIILAGTIYFAFTTKTHKERLKSAYFLILPYMVVEVLALGYTWATEQQSIFHAAEYSFGTSAGVHTIGHLVGGLTWEPLSVFVVMEILWLPTLLFRR